MLLEHKRYSGLGTDALVTGLFFERKLSWFWHGCSDNRKQLEHVRNYFCMDALVSKCSWSTVVIMFRACLLRKRMRAGQIIAMDPIIARAKEYGT